ncbi:MAG: hypothetical protein AAFP82_19280, partial [Bacteroidota bacterium]
MKKHSIFIIISLFLFFLSCKKNEITTNLKEFTVFNERADEGEDDSNLTFLFLSNQEGKILYEDSGENQESRIELKVKEDEQIDLTYGKIGNSFSIQTYRNIESGFILSRYNSDLGCLNKLQSNVQELEDRRKVTIEIEGISDYQRLHSSLGFLSIKTEEALNKIIFRSEINFATDYVIAILPKNQNTYKYLYVEFDDLEELSDAELAMKTSISEFKNIEPQKVNFDISGVLYRTRATVSTNNRLISIPLTQSTLPTDDNLDYTDIFLPPEIPMNQLQLSIGINSQGFQYFHNEIFNEIPESISFYDPEIIPLDIAASNYSISISQDYDFISTSYIYRHDRDEISKYSSSWFIYQPLSVDLTYNLPEI